MSIYFKRSGRVSQEEQQRQYDLEQSKIDPSTSVYLIKMTPPGIPAFYKIGYTTQTVKARFSWWPNNKVPPHFKIAHKQLPLTEAKQMERTLHNAFQDKRFEYCIPFGGHTECFHLTDDDVIWIKNVLSY
jgi:hypothetical protein